MYDALGIKALPAIPEEIIDDFKIDHLLKNAKSAILGAIELHNKPIFPCRYEVSIILTINAWELAMKAYILKYLPEHKLMDKYGKSKPFEECISLIFHYLANDFLIIKESLENLYKYRCDIIHYYGTDIEAMLYSLLRPNIISFSEFIKKYFEIDLSEEANLIILPIGFKRIISPIDFLSEKSMEGNEFVKGLIENIKKSAKTLTDNGFEDGLLCNYKMHIEKEHNIKNSDIIVGVTQDKEKASFEVGFSKKMRLTNDVNAQAIRLDEESIFRDYFNITYNDLRAKARKEIGNFREGRNFNTILSKIKQDESCFKKRCLDINPTPKSTWKPYFSELAFTRLKERYEKIIG